MTREKAIERVQAMLTYMETLDADEEEQKDIEAYRMAIAALKREQQILDAGYKNSRVEFMIGGRKFMVKEMAQ